MKRYKVYGTTDCDVVAYHPSGHELTLIRGESQVYLAEEVDVFLAELLSVLHEDRSALIRSFQDFRTVDAMLEYDG